MAYIAADDEIASGGNGALQYAVIRWVSRDDLQGWPWGDEVRVAENVVLKLTQFCRTPVKPMAQYSDGFIQDGFGNIQSEPSRCAEVQKASRRAAELVTGDVDVRVRRYAGHSLASDFFVLALTLLLTELVNNSGYVLFPNAQLAGLLFPIGVQRVAAART